jgi:hypothetical protein
MGLFDPKESLGIELKINAEIGQRAHHCHNVGRRRIGSKGFQHNITDNAEKKSATAGPETTEIVT